MVSFSCEVCNDTLVKKRLLGHIQRCANAYFTCIDCNTTFQGDDFQKHTQCITEDQKYQGKLYKPKQKQEPKATPAAKPEEAKQPKKSKQKKVDSMQVKSTSLYKVVKNLKKKHKLDTKEVLKKLMVANATLEFEN